MNMNNKNRKLLWLVGAVVAALYFGPQMVESSRRMAIYRQQMEAIKARTTNAGANATGGAGLPAATPAATPNAALLSLTGIWQGEQAQADHELCQLAVEIRESGPDQLAGYPRLACWPMMPYVPGQKFNPSTALAKSLSPISAVLSGTVKDGAVAFRVDKTIGATVEGCVLTSFTATPFGNGQLAVEWQKDKCGKGEMILRKVMK
jgi:hypothetical protein